MSVVVELAPAVEAVEVAEARTVSTPLILTGLICLYVPCHLMPSCQVTAMLGGLLLTIWGAGAMILDGEQSLRFLNAERRFPPPF